METSVKNSQVDIASKGPDGEEPRRGVSAKCALSRILGAYIYKTPCGLPLSPGSLARHSSSKNITAPTRTKVDNMYIYVSTTEEECEGAMIGF